VEGDPEGTAETEGAADLVDLELPLPFPLEGAAEVDGIAEVEGDPEGTAETEGIAETEGAADLVDFFLSLVVDVASVLPKVRRKEGKRNGQVRYSYRK